MAAVLEPRRPQAEPPQAAAVGLLSTVVFVSALGYFVDLYDLILFTVVRIQSLADLGVAGADFVSVGALLLNLQALGLIAGGIAWGVLADRRGRVRVLFMSIALYSLANLANAFVTDVTQYAALRFLAGFGLAGELGVAVTLLSEVLPPGRRAYGTVIVASIGVLGGLSAGLAAQAMSWRAAYALGGTLGLALLVLRFRLVESGLYASLSSQPVPRGSLRQLLASRERLRRFAYCVAAALPNWFAAGILLTFLPEIVRGLGATGPVSVATAVVIAYAGLGSGAALCGVASERLRTRWWAVAAFVAGWCAVLLLTFFVRGMSPAYYYGMVFLGALTTGYVGLMVLVTAEHFGTNLRATAAASMPNLVRGSVIPMTLVFVLLGDSLGLGFARAGLLIGLATTLLALWGLRGLRETYGRDLDFVET